MCKVSVVLPTYNGSAYIAEAIQSVLEQTYTDFELIIVNDCSTDNTLEIITEYAQKDSRIRIINNETNTKLPQALNIGFQSARGKYYTWTSDDNRYLPTAFEVMCRCLEENLTVGLVYCNMYLIDDRGNITEEGKSPEPDMLVRRNSVGACFMYRSVVAERVGAYDPEMFLAEDYDYWMRIYQQSALKHINETCYLYRVHGGSLTAQRQQQIKAQTAKLWLKYFDFIIDRLNEMGGQREFFDVLYNFAGGTEDILKFLCGYDKTYKWHRLYLNLRYTIAQYRRKGKMKR